MNKSIEFMKRRIPETPDTSYNMPMDGWDDAYVFNPITEFERIFGEQKVIKDDSNSFSLKLESQSLDGSQKGFMKFEVEYDPNAEFEYFTTTSSTHDGTLIFVGDNIRRLLEKIIFLQTQNKNKITEDFRKDMFSYSLKYTIGDIVMHSDFGMKEINGRNMMGQTDTVCLPIKFEIIKIG